MLKTHPREQYELCTNPVLATRGPGCQSHREKSGSFQSGQLGHAPSCFFHLPALSGPNNKISCVIALKKSKYWALPINESHSYTLPKRNDHSLQSGSEWASTVLSPWQDGPGDPSGLLSWPVMLPILLLFSIYKERTFSNNCEWEIKIKHLLNPLQVIQLLSIYELIIECIVKRD